MHTQRARPPWPHEGESFELEGWDRGTADRFPTGRRGFTGTLGAGRAASEIAALRARARALSPRTLAAQLVEGAGSMTRRNTCRFPEPGVQRSCALSLPREGARQWRRGAQAKGDDGSCLLLDRARLAREFGFTRVDVERIFRALPVVSLDGSRKVYVRRPDLERLIEESTTRPGEVRPIGRPALAV